MAGSSLKPIDVGIEGFPDFRPGQLETAIALTNSDYKAHFLQAPTGSGKSLLYITAAMLRGLRTLIVVPTKQLQNQIARDFPFVYEIFGHSHYPCGKNLTFEDETKDCHDRCWYQPKVVEARRKQFIIINTAAWIAISQVDPGRLGEFGLIVFDEGHGAWEILANQLSVTVMSSQLTRLLGADLEAPLSTSLNSDIKRVWVPWAEDILSRINRQRNKFLEGWETGYATKLERQLSIFVESQKQGVEWVLNSKGINFSTATLSPVWADKLSKLFLFRPESTILATSATLTQFDVSMMGLKRDNVNFIDLPSVFDPRLSPVVHIPTVSLSRASTDSDYLKLARTIDQIMTHHSDLKGLIHTVSFELQRKLSEKCQDPDRRIFSHDPGKLTWAINKLRIAQRPKLLATPSAQEGVDLPDDLCRLNIICKVPWPNLGIPQIKRRCTTNKDYVYYKIGQATNQASGRGTRHDKDSSITYITDNHWSDVSKKKSFFARSFRARWTTSNGPIPFPFNA
jgi:ATP-dependent DNA helicase DinG